MRTTLDIDNDVLQTVKALAQLQHSSAGQVISQLARDGLAKAAIAPGSASVPRNGVPVFAARPGELITNEHIQSLEASES